MNIVTLIMHCKLAPSNNEAKRLVKQNAVTFNDQVISNEKEQVSIKHGAVLKVGKRKFAKLRLDA